MTPSQTVLKVVSVSVYCGCKIHIAAASQLTAISIPYGPPITIACLSSLYATKLITLWLKKQQQKTTWFCGVTRGEFNASSAYQLGWYVHTCNIFNVVHHMQVSYLEVWDETVSLELGHWLPNTLSQNLVLLLFCVKACTHVSVLDD